MNILETKTYEEIMSEEIQLELKKNLSYKKLISKESLKLMYEAVPHLGFMISIILVLFWLLLNWIIGSFTSFDFGWNSKYGTFISISIVIFSFTYALFEIARCELPLSIIRKNLKLDLANKIIEVTEYTIKEVKLFEEPEHSGYIYFLLTSDNEVLALYDSESQYLAINGENPQNSNFKPKEKLLLSRAPISKQIFLDEFKGDFLDIPEPKEFTSKTRVWPEHGTVLNCKWEKIDAKYSA